MSRQESYRIRYTIAFIAEFAKAFNMKQQDAFQYLKRFKGLEYLKSFYDILHTLTFEDAIRSTSTVCNRNGGQLQYQAV